MQVQQFQTNCTIALEYLIAQVKVSAQPADKLPKQIIQLA